VQAHILGEVSILGSTLLRVYSWAILPIFILTQGQTILAELARLGQHAHPCESSRVM